MKPLYTTVGLLLSVQTVFFAQNLPSNVSKNDLLGYWTLNGNAQDASGNNFHGDTLNVEAVEDRFGNKNAALKFNGINSRVEINHDFFNVGMPNYTISLWLKSYNHHNENNYNDAQSILNTEPHNGIGISIHGSNNPFGEEYNDKFSLGIGTNPNNRDWDILGKVDNASNKTIELNKWTHYTLVKRDTFNFELYLNGELDKTFKAEKNSDSVLTKLVFGAIAKEIANTEKDENFLGELDDYGIWKRALNATEIRSLYSETASTSNQANEAQKTNVTISPNPTKNKIYVHSKDHQIIGADLKMIDLNGKVIFTEKITQFESEIALPTNIKSGNYMIGITNESAGTIYSNQLIIE